MKLTLSLSGGGSNGIVQVGYCRYFEERGFRFEVITGTSTGGLQGAMYAQMRQRELEQIWLGIGNRSAIYRNWLLGWAQGFFKRGLYNAAPLRKLIDQFVDVDRLIASPQRYVSCSVNLNRMEKFYCEATEEMRHLIKPFIYASAAFPIAFEPLRYGGEDFWDGGVMEPIPVAEAVRRCPDADFHIVGLCSPVAPTPKRDVGKTLLGAGSRALEAMFQEIYQSDVQRGGEKYWYQPNFVVIQPLRPVFDSSLDFDPSRYEAGIEIGYELAKLACSEAGL